MISAIQRDEELAAIIIRRCVCHGKHTAARKMQALVELIGKIGPIYGLAAKTGAGGVTPLHTEAFDDAVEYGVVVVSLHTQLQEVAAGFWHLGWEK